MGIYLNPGNENFMRFVSGDIYVDKTMMISRINTFMDRNNTCVCVSRPRRFGKTYAGNMLSAYYSKGCDSRDLFSRFQISADPSFEEKLNKYNVIKIDMNSEYQNTLDKDLLLRRLTREICKEMRKAFPSVDFEEDDSLAQCILRVYAETGETFVLLIDEYDVLVREKDSDRLFAEYLAFLNGLFKSDTLRPAISLAYLTGILPVVRSHIHVTSNRSYNNEDALQSAIYLAFIFALNRYTVVKEMTAGRGFADIIYIPLFREDPAMVVELKKNKTAESALYQIRKKEYFDCLSHYKGRLLFVGINYSEKDKTHTCRMEWFEKSV